MDIFDFFILIVIAAVVLMILSRITIKVRMKKVYVEERYNEVKRIR